MSKNIILAVEVTTDAGNKALVATKDSMEMLGGKLADGIVWALWRYTLTGFVGVLIIGAVLSRCAPTPIDSTDASPSARSGMTLRTDALTGCQYLQMGDGALTPRLDATGRPMCRVSR